MGGDVCKVYSINCLEVDFKVNINVWFGKFIFLYLVFFKFFIVFNK